MSSFNTNHHLYAGALSFVSQLFGFSLRPCITVSSGKQFVQTIARVIVIGGLELCIYGGYSMVS